MNNQIYGYGLRVYHKEDFIVILKDIQRQNLHGPALISKTIISSLRIKNKYHLEKCVKTLIADGYISQDDTGIYITVAGQSYIENC